MNAECFDYEHQANIANMDPAACTNIQAGLKYYEATNKVPIPFRVVPGKSRDQLVREFVDALGVGESFLVRPEEFDFTAKHIRKCRDTHKDRMFVWQREYHSDDIRIWRTD